MKYDSKFHAHFLHFFITGNMGFGPVFIYYFAIVQLFLAASGVFVLLILYVCNGGVVLVFQGQLSLLVCSTFVIDVTFGNFLFVNVVFAFVWLTFLVGKSGLVCVFACWILLEVQRIFLWHFT